MLQWIFNHLFLHFAWLAAVEFHRKENKINQAFLPNRYPKQAKESDIKKNKLFLPVFMCLFSFILERWDILCVLNDLLLNSAVLVFIVFFQNMISCGVNTR